MTTTPETGVLRRAAHQRVSAAPLPAADAPEPLLIIKPRSERRRRQIPRPIRRTFGPLLVLLLWWALTASGVVPSDTLASPQDVASRAGDLTANGDLPAAIGASLVRVVWGFAIGSVIGIGLALIAGLFRLGEDLIDATMGMLRTLPWVGLIPLFIIWFGIDEKPKIALVALGVTFPLYLNTYAGIRGVDAGLIEAGHSLGLRGWALTRHVVLPGALPSILVGLRYSLGIAWLALVFAEQNNASSGIGFLMNNAEQFFQTDVIVVCLVVYALLGMITDLLVRIAMKYLLAWRPTFEGA